MSTVVEAFEITNGELPLGIDHESGEVYILGDSFRGVFYVSRVSSLIWFSYRKLFSEPVPGTSYTSDSGWGCTHRSTQMLLCAALCRLLFGREFRLVRGARIPEALFQVLGWFEDTPRAPFSVHRIAAAASRGGNFSPGDWIGPASSSAALRELVEQFRGAHLDQVNMRVHLVHNGMIYEDQLERYFRAEEEQEAVRSLLVLCPCRLGLHSLDAAYTDVLKAWFRIDACVGLIGGSSHSSIYFCGYSDDAVIYLDPHTVQKSVRMAAGQPFSLGSFRSGPCAMPLADVDVSLSVGFLLESRDDIKSFCRDVRVAAAYSTLFSLTSESTAPTETPEGPQSAREEDGFLLL